MQSYTPIQSKHLQISLTYLSIAMNNDKFPYRSTGTVLYGSITIAI